ncbi:MAG: DUF1015 domain-containing protein [Balneolaceae bacterium]|nr:DUF1015 domain-containing protein [Balneolaceae bacterium]MBO6546006.1 DUF1015 domain-containing protein [Balneolaceae bacterium]MBO6647402.1 DUF1015 domain-containing protein [Balneolaceae bacterium]
MAIIKPFKAWRPKEEIVHEVSSVPYDVINTQEALKLAENNPTSFLHIIRPEIDLSSDVDIYAAEVYEQGKDNLSSLLSSPYFLQEETDALYIYRLGWEGNSKTGVFGCVSVKDYDHEIILKHELTRPDKEDDRTKHILTQQAHAEPVMLTYKDNDHINNLIKEHCKSNTPLYDFESDDGVKHSFWRVDEVTAIVLAFSDIPKFYIADGHHRCASAARAAHEMESQNPEHNGKEEYNFFPAVLFPKSETSILSYNRVVHSLPEDFLQKLRNDFTITEKASPIPAAKGNISLYKEGTWFGLTLPESKKKDVSSSLDVARLQEYILEPYLNITNQRTDKNIDFVGGIRGTKELEKLVDSGKAELGISMFPTSVSELIAVSDAGLLMPPKSTWFEPKLRSGVLIHTF